MALSGVAAVIVGSEILTAKVQDANGPLLIRRLRDRGVPLRWMACVHDDVEAIVEAVQLARRRATHVLTSGGIGPTHDDVTVRSVAQALGRPVVRLPQMVDLVKRHHRDADIPETMRLADAPEGATLLTQEGVWYPVLTCDDVFMLPGIPQLFAIQLERVLQEIPGRPVHVRALYLGVGESPIAAVLDRVAAEAPDVAIGSYPQFGPGVDYRVKLTVEGEALDPVLTVLDRLKRELPAGSVIREAGG